MAQSIVGSGAMSSVGGLTYRTVIGRVTTAQGEPVRGARVELVTNSGAEEFGLVDTDLAGRFRRDYTLFGYDGKEFIVLVTVSKKGYPKAHAYANYGASGKPYEITIVLRPAQNEPTLLSQADLISALAPKLRHLDASDGLAAKDVKTYDRGAADFLERNRLDSAVPLLEKLVAV